MPTPTFVTAPVPPPPSENAVASVTLLLLVSKVAVTPSAILIWVVLAPLLPRLPGISCVLPGAHCRVALPSKSAA